METNLEDLIAKIKKEGIDEAKSASEKIIQEAQEQAQQIVQEAKLKAKELLEEAQKKIERLKANTESSLRRAARDLTLVLKSELTNLFNRILKREISEKLDPDFMKEIIIKIVDKWSPEKEVSLDVLVNKNDKEKLEKLLFSQLKQEAKNTIEIKVSNTIERGFRIGIKGENIYYDFTDESILESLKEFLNPAISAILNASDK